MERKSFLIYISYKEQLSLLSKSERGEVLMAMISYAETGVVPKLSGAVMMCFSFIKSQMDRDDDEYNRKCEANRKNGKKGGRPKKTEDAEPEKKEPNETQETQRLFEKPKKPDNDNDNDNEDDNDNKGNIHTCKSAKANLAQVQLFQDFWNAYPKKRGKGNCEKWFTSRKPSKALVVTMLSALSKQKRSEDWKKEDGRYIPMPYTWLNGKRWEDNMAVETERTASYDIDELEEMSKFNPMEDEP